MRKVTLTWRTGPGPRLGVTTGSGVACGVAAPQAWSADDRCASVAVLPVAAVTTLACYAIFVFVARLDIKG
jgi:hypothetical protein